ncbi:MAG: hypothetical protein HFH96_13795 [Lachnospiraceae bacterium]|jgi:hypothetical protein|nr:hypothetical protein [uncultured Acetatifactor sp.]MCI9232149.1 hypothetical protein [Lachnospiraceae bacterium]
MILTATPSGKLVWRCLAEGGRMQKSPSRKVSGFPLTDWELVPVKELS